MKKQLLIFLLTNILFILSAYSQTTVILDRNFNKSCEIQYYTNYTTGSGPGNLGKNGADIKYRGALYYYLPAYLAYANINSCSITFPLGSYTDYSSIQATDLGSTYLPLTATNVSWTTISSSAKLGSALNVIWPATSVTLSDVSLKTKINASISQGDMYVEIGLYNGKEAEGYNLVINSPPQLTINYTPTKPSAPTNLNISSITSSSFILSWTASYGDVTGYNVYKDGILYATTSSTSMLISGLCPNTLYQLAIKAYSLTYGDSDPSSTEPSTTSSPTISGPSLLCSSNGTFTVLNASEITVSWEKSSNLDYVSGSTGVSCTFIPNGNGIGWVQATVSTTCGNIILPSSDFWVGPPDNSQIRLDFGAYPELCYDRPAQINIISVTEEFEQGITRYDWTFGPWENYVIEYITETIAENNHVLVQIPYGESPQLIEIRASNSCGMSMSIPFTQLISPVDCGYFMSLSPNPASDYVIVTLAPEPVKTNKAVKENANVKTYTVRLYDYFGSLVYNVKKSGDNFNLSTSNLKDGVYIVEVSDGKNVNRKTLLIKKN